MPIYDIAFYVAIFFLAGVTAASFNLSGWLVITAILMTIVISSLTALLKKSAYFFILSALSTFLFVGFFYYNFYEISFNQEAIIFDEKINFQGVVINDPERGMKSQKFKIQLSKPYAGTAIVYTKSYPEFNYGDLLNFSGVIKKSDYGQNLSSYPTTEVISHGNGSSIKASLYNLKRSIVSNFQDVLPVDSAALMAGLTLGEREEFSKNFNEALNKSGTTHIVALSGYNISILAIAISYSLGYFFSRRITFYLSILIITAFVLMAGAEPSVVRAAIMGVIAMIALQAGRIYSFRNVIALSAAAMVLVDPKILVFDVGFELSFLALMGIVYLLPVIKKFLMVDDEERSLLGWKENGLTTFSAQLAVIPILLTKFGYFSLTSLIANILILEVVPVAMFFGFILALLGFISYQVALILSWFANLILSYIILVVNLCSQFSLPVTTQSFSLWASAIYYLAIIIFIFYVNRKPEAK